MAERDANRSVIGPGVETEGTLRSNGDVTVDGTIKGPIVASKRVVLSQTCNIESLVVSPALEVEPGACLVGTFCVTPDVAERERALGGQIAVKQTAKPQKVNFKFVGKDAKTVGLFGDFNQWDEKKALPLDASNGAWTLDLELPPGRYEYLFLVDGEHCPDPDNSEKKKNDFGGENSVLHVS